MSHKASHLKNRSDKGDCVEVILDCDIAHVPIIFLDNDFKPSL